MGNSSSLSESSDVIYLGNELDIELWFKGETSKVRSVLIRATTPDGSTKTAFMHIDNEVRQIPVFNNADPLTLADSNPQKSREFTWQPDRKKFQSRSRVRSILSISTTVIALVILACSLTGFLQLRVVLTGSMKPAINPGDLVVAATTKVVEPRIGKVVLYSARDLQGKAVTVWSHRIISGNTKAGFTIKGDANPQPDIGVIPLRDIQSVVVLRIPFVGHLFNIYSLVLIFGGFLVLSFANPLRKRE
jgi:signal peptidase I